MRLLFPLLAVACAPTTPSAPASADDTGLMDTDVPSHSPTDIASLVEEEEVPNDEIVGDTSGGDCVEDMHNEPNDTMQYALQTTRGVQLSVVDNSDDWIGFEVEGGGQAFVDVTFSHADGDIELTVRDDTGHVIGQSYSSSDDESVAISNPGSAARTYYAEIDLVIGSGGGCNRYDFSVTAF